MAKAIKHIQAGLLHIKILGKVPDRPLEKKHRGARANATPPAQCFYNLKLAYREVMLLLAANFGRGTGWLPVHLTMPTYRQTKRQRHSFSSRSIFASSGAFDAEGERN